MRCARARRRPRATRRDHELIVLVVWSSNRRATSPHESRHGTFRPRRTTRQLSRGVAHARTAGASASARGASKRNARHGRGRGRRLRGWLLQGPRGRTAGRRHDRCSCRVDGDARADLAVAAAVRDGLRHRHRQHAAHLRSTDEVDVQHDDWHEVCQAAPAASGHYPVRREE